MPHLSPMSWVMMLLLTWLMILIYSSTSWWSFSPSFMNLHLKNTMGQDKAWNW